VRLSGHQSRAGRVEIVRRSRRERWVRALILLLVWPWACLLAFFIPPHGEPLALAFFGGMYMIYRALTTAYVVRFLDAPCPRCGNALQLRRNGRLKESLEIPCYHCHFHPRLELESVRE
jgi:hypothetical protein